MELLVTSECGAIAIAMMVCSLTSAQCEPGWFPGPGLAGTDYVIQSSTFWDPDGDGPAQSVLVIGGNFSTAGTAQCSHIAAWDGKVWSPLGEGLNGIVYAMAPYHGELIAGGQFTASGGAAVSNIARWDGKSWKPLGRGLNEYVDHMIVYGDRLIVSGGFTSIGGISAKRLAAWDGESWSSIGSQSGPWGSGVYAMAVFQGELVLGGVFSDVSGLGPGHHALWNGTSWRRLAADAPGLVTGLGTVEGELIAVGDAGIVDSYQTGFAVRWRDEQWQSMGKFVGALRFALVSNDQLYTGGASQIDSKGVSPAVRWDGTSWQDLHLSTASQNAINTAASYATELVFAGNFVGSGGLTVSNVARWNGEWRALSPGPVGSFATLAAFSGQLVAGGGGFADEDGDLGAVVTWDGAAWRRLGNGPVGQASSLYAGNGMLLAAGRFRLAGSAYVNRVQQWNGASWSVLGPSFSGTIRSVVVAADGSAYAGGTFGTIGSTTVNRVARWNGSAWLGLGSLQGLGVSGGDVNALASFGAGVAVGGNFTTAGVKAAANIAYWDGAHWTSLGDGTAGTVNALAVYHGELIAGGSFSAAGGSPAANLAAWNGTQWRAIGDCNGPVRAITVQEDSLIIGGDFVSVDGVGVARIARWNGSTWQPMDGGVNNSVTALAAYGDEIAASGTFSTAGGHFSKYFARWSSAPRAPTLTVHPNSVATCGGASVTFQTEASGTAPLSYRWRRDGVDLVNGAGPSGEVIEGATSASMRLTRVALGSAGVFDCVVSNSCGSAASEPASLTVCPADFDCNAYVNGVDFDLFSAAFEIGELSADIDANGDVNGDDMDLFVVSFEMGC